MKTRLFVPGRDGAMAQQIQIPAANLHVVPEGVSDREAVFAEPLAAACRVLEQQVLSTRSIIVPVAGTYCTGVWWFGDVWEILGLLRYSRS